MKISLRTFFLAISGLVLAPVAWAQTASNVITRVLPAGSVKASISSFVATPSNVNKPITSYQVTFPDGGIGGTLSANGNVVSNGTVIPAGQANLTFEPGAVAGVFVFTYTATETNNGGGNPTTSTPASYTLPISPKAFSFGSGFDFSTADNNSSWTNRTFTSNTVTVNTTGYSTSASSPAVEFQVGDRQIGANAAALPTKALYWYTDYSSTANSSTVTYTFDKPLRGFSVVLQDIDASTTGGNNFIDQVQLDGYATTAGTVPMTLSAADFTIRANGVNAYTGSTVPNTVSGTGTGTSNANPADAVIVSFPQSISKLVITYRNTAPTASALTQQIIGISSFGWAAATATNAAPLPVTLSSFEAVAKGDAAQLQWTTASEKNNDRFEVERSVTGAAFERVGTVNGHGTTTNPQAYFFTDGVTAAHGRLVYYRLRQVDFDGVSTYSPVRSVSFGSKGAVAVNLSLFPNPTTGAATLDLSKLPIGDYFLTALDLAGRQMLHQKLEGGQVAPLDLRALPNGTFLLKITGAQLNKTLRVVKE